MVVGEARSRVALHVGMSSRRIKVAPRGWIRNPGSSRAGPDETEVGVVAVVHAWGAQMMSEREI